MKIQVLAVAVVIVLVPVPSSARNVAKQKSLYDSSRIAWRAR